MNEANEKANGMTSNAQGPTPLRAGKLHEDSLILDRRWLSPCVYALWSDHILLYIGSGTTFSRCISSMYEKELTPQAITVEIIPCATREIAYELERKLILQYLPLLNTFVPKIMPSVYNYLLPTPMHSEVVGTKRIPGRSMDWGQRARKKLRLHVENGKPVCYQLSSPA